MSKLEDLKERATQLGLAVTSWDPGDGRRYRVQRRTPDNPNPDYFDGGDLFWSKKTGEVAAYLSGWDARFDDAMTQFAMDEQHAVECAIEVARAFRRRRG